MCYVSIACSQLVFWQDEPWNDPDNQGGTLFNVTEQSIRSSVEKFSIRIKRATVHDSIWSDRVSLDELPY